MLIWALKGGFEAQRSFLRWEAEQMADGYMYGGKAHIHTFGKPRIVYKQNTKTFAVRYVEWWTIP